MPITLAPPRQKFVDDQVRSGRFASPAQIVAEALSRLMREREEKIY
jgi:Arc/MetJ-type ribon-helix-helix transcriptional regulator